MGKKHELQEGLNQLSEKLDDLIDCARELYDSSQEFRCFGGQLDQYFIGWMRKFLNDHNQPGSIESLQRMLDRNEEEYDKTENDEN